MPTILLRAGFRVLVLLPPREHRPPHVHVLTGDAEVVIALLPIGVRSVYRMSDADVVRAVRLVERHLQQLIDAWRRYHG